MHKQEITGLPMPQTVIYFTCRNM